MPESLEQVLVDELGQAAVLRHNGHAHDADLIERVVGRVKESGEEYLTFLTETEAQLWSAKSQSWLRSRFPSWERQGHAKWSERGQRQRLYRRCVLPRRARLGEVQADAEREATRPPVARSA